MDELPIIEIDRFLKDEMGTWGALRSGEFHCFTIERPWVGNAPFVSCIPEGLYKVSRGEFSRGRPPYLDLEVASVPGRSAIEIHAANLPDELSGCIAPVETLKYSQDRIYGTNSKHTLSLLLSSFDADEAYLIVK